MRRVLVVAPHFPPVGSADGHRARMSVRYFAECGWEPHVLTVDAALQEEQQEIDLLSTLPSDLHVTATSAVPPRWTRPFGIGNVVLRALPQLYRAGRLLIRQHDIDLVYFSTTLFAALPLGRLWKQTLGVPYVIDVQDPWVSEYPNQAPGFKARLARALHARLEPFTMRQVDGLIAVSDAYIATLQRRYPWIREDSCATIPFGASEGDMSAARAIPWSNPYFAPDDRQLHGVSVGRGGHDMEIAARILFRAACRTEAVTARRVSFAFIGTDYAPAGSGHPTIAPIAAAEGVNDRVREWTDRLAYLAGLRLLAEAGFLIVLGSDDPQYSPSKVYPYLLAGRPIVSVLHERCPIADLMRRAGCGPVITFRSAADVGAAAHQLAHEWPAFFDRCGQPYEAPTALVQTFSAREFARRQTELFTRVLRTHDVHAAEVVCRG
jgi:glycosyltransferase involved in cell wall biosynthesis